MIDGIWMSAEPAGPYAARLDATGTLATPCLTFICCRNVGSFRSAKPWLSNRDLALDISPADISNIALDNARCFSPPAPDGRWRIVNSCTSRRYQSIMLSYWPKRKASNRA